MEGTLHALALMAVIVGSAALCYCYGKRPEAVAPAFVLTLVGVLCGISLFVPFPRNAPTSVPPWDADLFTLLATHQWPILACCLVLVLVFIPSRWIRAASVAVFLLLGTLFTLHAARMYSLVEYDIRTVGLFRRRELARAAPPGLLDCWHVSLTGFDYDDGAISRRSMLSSMAVWRSPGGAVAVAPPPPSAEEITVPMLEDVNTYFPEIMLDLIPAAEWHGPVQGVGMLLVIGLSLAVLIIFRRRIAPWRQWGWRVLYGTAIFIAAGLLLMPLFTGGLYTPQWMIPALCLGVVGAFSTASRKVLLPFVAVVLLLGVMLCLHMKWYEEEAHSFGVDRSKCSGWHYGSLAHSMAMLRAHVRVAGNPVISAGWLEEEARWKDLPDPPRLHKSNDYTVSVYHHLQPAWHTPLTQLYRTTDETVAIWYPGGPLSEGLEKLEWRRYP
ncbi:MAG: hypothetical protein ACYC6A_09200 [Armatimonadota bacterium]